MHQFPTNFYGNTMAVMVLGYIRPELDYISKGTLASFFRFTVLTFRCRGTHSGYQHRCQGRAQLPSTRIIRCIRE